MIGRSQPREFIRTELDRQSLSPPTAARMRMIDRPEIADFVQRSLVNRRPLAFDLGRDLIPCVLELRHALAQLAYPPKLALEKRVRHAIYVSERCARHPPVMYSRRSIDAT